MDQRNKTQTGDRRQSTAIAQAKDYSQCLKAGDGNGKGKKNKKQKTAATFVTCNLQGISQ